LNVPRLLLALVFALGPCLVAVPAVAQPATADACSRLSSLSLPQTSIQKADLVPAGAFALPPPNAPLADLPSFCRVVGVVEPAITFEVWLPAVGWNHRFEGVGGGGLAGTISYGALAAALQTGFATASTDTGHVGGTDGSWAIGHRELLADFGYRSVHEMTGKGKAIAAAFYGSPPQHSYWSGCSTGGRQGMMEVQRYPDDYDGALAGAPAIDWSSLHAAQLWAAQATLGSPDSYIRPEQLTALNDAILANWDELDGVADGVIDDPPRVRLDFGALKAAAGLTEPQLTALRKLYAGPVNAAGQQVYPGLAPGGELNWPIIVAGPGPFSIGEIVYRDLVFENREWNWRTLNFDADIGAARERFAEDVDALDPNLLPFAARGGKLILYHGWSDPLIQAERTRRYYVSVADAVGGMDTLRDFARLFLMPGVAHCRGGSGPDTFDGLSTLIDWVERGVAPDQLVAAHVTDGVVDRTRPLCPYPQVERWTGAKDTNDAASFACAS
jgi:feruloyl esterase